MAGALTTQTVVSLTGLGVTFGNLGLALDGVGATTTVKWLIVGNAPQGV